MKNIEIYKPEKYNNEKYEKVEENIYKTIHETSNVRSFRSATEEEKEYFKKNTNLFQRIFGWKQDKDFMEASVLKINDRTFMKDKRHPKKLMVDNNDIEYIYVTTLSFVQEPELNEGTNAANISQYPLEDIEDEYMCYISDSYDELNKEGNEICYLEFASSDIKDIQKLHTTVGKHVYNVEDGEYVKLNVE